MRCRGHCRRSGEGVSSPERVRRAGSASACCLTLQGIRFPCQLLIFLPAGAATQELMVSLAKRGNPREPDFELHAHAFAESR